MKSLFNIPNALSFFRLPIAFLVIAYWESPVKYALLIVGILLDFADGYAARELNQITKIGGVIDPLFDKIFVLIIFTYAFIDLQLPFYFVLFFFLRDIFTTFAAIFIFYKNWQKKLEIKARFFGKITTNTQFITLILMVIGHEGSVVIGLYALLLISLITIGDYIIYFHNKIKKC